MELKRDRPSREAISAVICVSVLGVVWSNQAVDGMVMKGYRATFGEDEVNRGAVD